MEILNNFKMSQVSSGLKSTSFITSSGFTIVHTETSQLATFRKTVTVFLAAFLVMRGRGR